MMIVVLEQLRDLYVCPDGHQECCLLITKHTFRGRRRKVFIEREEKTFFKNCVKKKNTCINSDFFRE